MVYDYPASQSGWTKYVGNPVLGGPELGTCFDVHVHLLKNKYRMYFSWRPQRSVAFADSVDGINWSAPEILLGPNPETGWEDDINRNAVLRCGDRYLMWYTGQARGFSRIGCAESRDGVHYRRCSSTPVLIPEYPWEKESVMNPFVLFDDERGIFRMWYAGGETYEPNALGYAESQDGLNWKKSPFNPIFVHGDAPYDAARVGGCEVVKMADGTFRMFYIGYEDIDTARICMASSPDGITRWRRSSANPLLSPEKGSWDADACYKPSVIYDRRNSRWMLWYNGRFEHNEYVGLAVHSGYELD